MFGLEWGPLTMRPVVIVNCKDGRAFRGALVRRQGDLLFLRNVELLEPRAEPVPLDGEVVLLRENVAFIQAP